MRWPIRLQLLVPMVGVVLLAGVLATIITAAGLAVRVRNEQQEDLRRVVKTLGEANFPLTGPCWRQVKGLSGAELVLVRPDGVIEESTLRAEAAWLDDLARTCVSRGQAGTDGDARIGRTELSGRFDSGSGRRSGDEARDALGPLSRGSGCHSRLRGRLSGGDCRPWPRWWRWPLPPGFRGGWPVRSARWWHERRPSPAAILPPYRLSGATTQLRDLVESINRMAEQLAEYERQVRRQERLRTLGSLRVDGPPASQRGHGRANGHRATPARVPQGRDESLDVALRQLRLMESYLRQFLTRKNRPRRFGRVNVGPLVAEVLALVRPSYVHAGIELEFVPPPDRLFVEGDREALRQLVTNLVINAAEAAVAGPRAGHRASTWAPASTAARDRCACATAAPGRTRPSATGCSIAGHDQARRCRPGPVCRPPNRRPAPRPPPLAP